MRIRSTKPEFWSSRTISSVSWDARLVLKGLESYVDDNGVGRFDMELIVSDLFPRDHFRNPPEVVARVSEAITELLEAGLLWKYDAEDTSRGDRTVKALYVSNWESLQRIDKPNKGRIRRPDGTLEYRESVIAEPSRSSREDFGNPPEKVAPGTGEQGNRGTEEQGTLKSGFYETTTPTEQPNTDLVEARKDVTEILDYLDQALGEASMPIPNRTQRNQTAARLLLDKDGHTVQAVKACIDFTFTDEFWRTNIRSMSKLRDKWPQLRGAWERRQARGQSREPVTTERMLNAIQIGEQLQAEADAQARRELTA